MVALVRVELTISLSSPYESDGMPFPYSALAGEE